MKIFSVLLLLMTMFSDVCAMQTTRWEPDTCGCKIMLEWDETVPVEQRVHNIQSVLYRCSEHQELSVINDLFSNVIEQNRRKNKVYAIAEARGLNLDEITWSYTGTGAFRVLYITVPSNASVKRSLQNEADNLFGPGRVVVQ